MPAQFVLFFSRNSNLKLFNTWFKALGFASVQIYLGDISVVCISNNENMAVYYPYDKAYVYGLGVMHDCPAVLHHSNFVTHW